MRNVLAKLPGLDKVTPDGLKPQGYLGPAPEFNYTKKDPNNPKQCASRLIRLLRSRCFCCFAIKACALHGLGLR